MQKNSLSSGQPFRRSSWIVFVTTASFVILAACTNDSSLLNGPRDQRTPPITATVMSATGCGIDQLGSGKPSTELHRQLGRLTDPPGTLRRVLVTANFPSQWHGSGGYIGNGIIITQYSPAWDCQMDGGTSYVDVGEYPLVTDSVVAKSPPPGIDSVAWNRQPTALQRLMLDLANTLVEHSFSCSIPEIGPVTCAVMREFVVVTVFSNFTASQERSRMDAAILRARSRHTASPFRELSRFEVQRIQSFSLGCALEGRLRTGGLAGYIVASETEDWAAKIGSASMSLDLEQTSRFLEPRFAELVLSGAKASRSGNSCFSVLEQMMEAPMGNNWLLDGGLGGNGGDGGGGTQF
jgi:hypothetical protein